MRLPGMLRSLAANLRAGAEPNGTVLNVVLPRPAGHNIALAAELSLAQSPSGVAAVASAAASAEPTDALGKLEKKMTLVFAKDTLEKTIQMISDEAGVPMEIVGPDLQLEGITKNQSFGLDEQDKSAKAILKVVLQKANPDGKLVYVVTKQDGAEAILITTRAAAQKRGDTIAQANDPGEYHDERNPGHRSPKRELREYVSSYRTTTNSPRPRHGLQEKAQYIDRARLERTERKNAMIIVMQAEAAQSDLDHVVTRVEGLGLRPT